MKDCKSIDVSYSPRIACFLRQAERLLIHASIAPDILTPKESLLV